MSEVASWGTFGENLQFGKQWQLLLPSLFGGLSLAPADNPHLRNSARRPIIAGPDSDPEYALVDGLPDSTRKMTRRLETHYWVVGYISGVCICGKIGWDSVMRMGANLWNLFFYEAFLYYNPLLLVILMVWLWGVNLWAFSLSGVDYAAIFDLDQNHLSHREIWKALLYCMAAVILISPFNVFYLSSRYYLLWTVGRMAFPLQPVTFSDFFLADILTSLSKVFSDLERSVCRMVHHQVATVPWFEADPVCGNHSIAIPFVLVLPYLFRLFQCVRQYKDSREITNIWNAGKYFTAVPVIFLSALKYHVAPDTWTHFVQPSWIIFCLANTLFSFFWDVLRDWDLSVLTRIFRFTRPNLCSRLLLGQWMYVWVIGSNLILRWTWSYKLSAHLRHNYLTVFTVTVLEIFRRFQWVFFRIENEWHKLSRNPRPNPHPHLHESEDETPLDQNDHPV